MRKITIVVLLMCALQLLQGCCMFQHSAVPAKITKAITVWEKNTQSLHVEWKRAVETPDQFPTGTTKNEHLEHQETLWTATEALANLLRLWAEENQNETTEKPDSAP